MLSVLFFLSFCFLPRRSHFFRLNHVRKAWNRCFHSRFSSEAIFMGFFFTETSACVVVGDRNSGFFHFAEIFAECRCVIAINPKVSSLRSQSLFGSFCVIRDFTKGHFIDDSNEYKFIHVPTSSSIEKKHIFDYHWLFNFFRRKFEPV